MASGVTVTDDCVIKYQDIQKNKVYRFVIYTIKNNNKEIDVEVVGDKNASYDDFLSHLHPGKCCYGVYDYEYKHQAEGATGESLKQKLVLMAWCPDDAVIKQKMLYSSSYDALKKKLVGISKYIQATDLSEACQAAVEEKLRSTDRA